ncbi:MAG: tetratricopeptide repeat protein [Candidatus Lokiarchaeota archaeon]|nr:tetratricopeptide repeat protein [Candidatus Lokiarchaeota archaeon]
MQSDPIIPEFAMYSGDLDKKEIEELNLRLAQEKRSSKNRFLIFTDLLLDFIGSGEWKNHSDAFIAMCAKAAFLRGKYGYNQILAKETTNITCNGYAAAAYCRQSLDPRWINNLRNYVNQAWQSSDYIAFAELSGQLAAVLIDLGYADHSKEVAEESIERVTKATTHNPEIRKKIQLALLRPRIILAYIASTSELRDEAMIRLDAAEDASEILDHQLALVDVEYFRARVMHDFREIDRALDILTSAIRKYERMDYLLGVARARNLRGVIYLGKGLLQEARDQFEELLIIQQQLNYQVGLASTLINVGEIDRALGQLEQMETYNQRALEISQEAEFVKGIALSNSNLGDVELRRGNIEEALKRYMKSIKIVEDSGMKELLRLFCFLAGDAYYATQKYDKALEMYKRGRKAAVETGDDLIAFHADVSELVLSWTSDNPEDKDVLNRVRDLMDSKDEFLESTSSEPMIELRRRIHQDDSLESSHCVLFDIEKNYECRADRDSLKKECFGNLFWKGVLCSYFVTFLNRLYPD